MSAKSESIVREYYCRVCKETHEICLHKKISEKQSKYPFPYFFLHGELKNILTTLYLDKHLDIRGAEVHKLTDDDIFSKDHLLSITSTLVAEIEELRKENEHLRLELNKETRK